VRIIAAIGGNALLRRGEALEIETQRRNLARAAVSIAALAEAHELVVTHGNGPQVGLLALQSEALDEVAPYPLDVLDAESEGLIGYLIERELRRHLPGREIAALLTQVRVDPDDPAFEAPSKPIGPIYDASEIEALARACGWAFRPDGRGYRRVVPSPEPKAILELGTIRLLLDAGVVVVCAGGGGIPVAVDADLVVRGVEAVVDKDLTAALLATALGADALLLLTDVGGQDRLAGPGRRRDPNRRSGGLGRLCIRARYHGAQGRGGVPLRPSHRRHRRHRRLGGGGRDPGWPERYPGPSRGAPRSLRRRF
jgi:carbamate kinase